MTDLDDGEGIVMKGNQGLGASSDLSHDDCEYDDYEEWPEGAEWCNRCQGLGMAECYCGGDQCYCQNNGEMDCPRCGGEGRWVPTPAQIAAREETTRWSRELHEWLSTPPTLNPGDPNV